MKRGLVFVVFLLSIHFGFTQSKRGNIGVFGNSAPIVIDFNFEPAKIEILPTDGIEDFSTREGSASICDQNGNLLFFTDGYFVWNKRYELMPNYIHIPDEPPFNIPTTTQVAIVPFPKDPFLYYIISSSYQGRSMYYSLVDLRLDGGKGDLIESAVVIDPASTEKVCVVKHASGEAVWVVTHEFGTDRFKTFLIDEHGINVNPIITSVGRVHTSGFAGYNAIGYLQASQDGTRIACAVDGNISSLELFSFDNATGKLSNPIDFFDTPKVGGYGVEFSPDGSKLYLSCEDGGLYQYDLSIYEKTNILASEITISPALTSGGALQLGPDGKIYRVGRINSSTLDVIENPNNPGLSCNFRPEQISLLGETVWTGLPEFIYHPVEPEITYSSYCEEQLIEFDLIKIKAYKKICWNFGDPESGTLNTSEEKSPTHYYDSPGTYTVSIKVVFDDESEFDYKQPVRIKERPSLNLGKDTVLCLGQSINVIVETDGNVGSVFWNDGDVAMSKVLSDPGKFWATVSNAFCTRTDTIKIEQLLPPSFTLSDTVLCYFQHMEIKLDPIYDYTWDDGTIANHKLFYNADDYSVTGRNRCGSHKETIKIAFVPRLTLSFVEQTTLCAGASLNLNALNENAQYLWQDGSTASSFKVIKAGDYSVEVSNRCEVVSGDTRVEFLGDEGPFVPNVITPNGDTLNDFFVLDGDLKDSDIEIFNRWGDRVFSSVAYANDWNAAGLETGVYYYSIRDACGHRFKGAIQVLK